MKNRKAIHLAGNGLLALGTAIGLYGAIDLVLRFRDLPPGACPFDMNRPLFLVALVLVVASLVLSHLEKPSGEGK